METAGEWVLQAGEETTVTRQRVSRWDEEKQCELGMLNSEDCAQAQTALKNGSP